MAEKLLGELMVVTIDVTTGTVKRVDGVTKAKVGGLLDWLSSNAFPAEEVSDYEQVQAAFAKKPSDNCALMLHTTSSPGCTWVLQDGWWKKVCN
jgi:hypothetical protein